MGKITLVCDLGGVFVRLCYLSLKRAFETLQVENFDEKYGQLIKSFIFFEFETGRIGTGEFRNHLRSYFNINERLLDASIDEAWNALLSGISERDILALRRLKQMKFRVILYSNNNPIHANGLKKSFSKQWKMLEEVVDKIYFSHEFGYRKPNQDSFRSLLLQENIEQKDTFFIDDSIEYIAGALKIGIHSFHLNKRKNMRFKDEGFTWVQEKLKQHRVYGDVQGRDKSTIIFE